MGDTLLSKARKQSEAAEIVVKEQRAKLAEAETALVDATKNVAFLRNVVSKAFDVSCDLSYVWGWLSDQEDTK